MPLPRLLKKELNETKGTFVTKLDEGLHINLMGEGIKDKDVDDLVSLCKGKNIVSLDLSYNNITDRGAKLLAKEFVMLKTLHVRDNAIGDDGASCLAGLSLDELDICRNNLSCGGVDKLQKNFKGKKLDTDDNPGSVVVFHIRKGSSLLLHF